jgi:C1A family cysteine protease
MFRVLILSVLALSVSAHNLNERFEEWIGDFRMNFRDSVHREHVYSNWVSNDKYISEVNAKNMTYTLGHNQLSGMDQSEYSNYLGFNAKALGKFAPSHIKEKLHEVECLYDCVEAYKKEHKLSTVQCVKGCIDDAHDNVSLSALPDSVNWVDNGAVTPVKDQGQCGSCWSFSTTGALEGAYYIKNADLVSFSEQELVDCDNRKNGGTDMGCNGGLMDNAFNWIEKNGGLCTESAYPYTSGTTKTSGTCETSCEPVGGSNIVNYVDVSKNSDSAMMTALFQQPVSIAIEADQKDFQLYKSGVFTGDCGTNLDHGVLAVGYGTLDGEDYYLVKNSWASTWGDNGYIRLGRGSQYNSGAGQCGMLMQASYPEV